MLTGGLNPATPYTLMKKYLENTCRPPCPGSPETHGGIKKLHPTGKQNSRRRGFEIASDKNTLSHTGILQNFPYGLHTAEANAKIKMLKDKVIRETKEKIELVHIKFFESATARARPWNSGNSTPGFLKKPPVMYSLK